MELASELRIELKLMNKGGKFLQWIYDNFWSPLSFISVHGYSFPRHVAEFDLYHHMLNVMIDLLQCHILNIIWFRWFLI